MKTGEKIARARREVNLTQDQLAELLDVSRQSISKWESDLAYPETVKIAKLADVLKVSCDYLLKDEMSANPEITLQNGNKIVVDWTKLYPILTKYQNTVDCKKYHIVFSDMISAMMSVYQYSLEDTVLVLRDLFYQTYLEMQKKQ